MIGNAKDSHRHWSTRLDNAFAPAPSHMLLFGIQKYMIVQRNVACMAQGSILDLGSWQHLPRMEVNWTFPSMPSIFMHVFVLTTSTTRKLCY